MKIVNIKKHNVCFYDSIYTLPIRRFAKWNKHHIIKLEVGSTIEDYDRRTIKGLGYIESEDKQSALVEFTNQRQCLHHALEEYLPDGMALAVMVHSINGRRYVNYQEADLEAILDKLDSIGFTKAMMDETLVGLKKK